MLAVNPDGVVGIAWYDRRINPHAACQHTYFTASLDGGRSVLPPVRLSQAESCLEGPGNAWVANSWPMGGDYGSLVIDGDGRFHIVWADSRSGRSALRRAVVSVPMSPP